MRKNNLIFVAVIVFAGLVVEGCTASPSQVTNHAASATIQVVDSATATLSPSDTPLPTSTATATLTPTITETLTVTPTPTETSTPTRTPSRTPAFNLPGLHQVNRCGRTTYHYNDNRQVDVNGSNVVTVDLCVTTVLVNKDWTMQFNIEWRLISWDGTEPSRYMYASNDYMSLGDDRGNWYSRIGDSGPPTDNDIVGGKENTYTSWYLFPPVVEGARELTLYDGAKKVAVTGIILWPGR